MGLLVSLVSIFLGLGGGLLLVPLLPFFLDLTIKEAVATSLLTIAFVVSHNTFKFHQAKLIRWPVVLWMGPASAITAIVATQISQRVDGRYILMALLGLLALVALRTLVFSFVSKSYQAKKTMGPADKGLSLLGGALAGTASGFAGVGSGIILSPVMIFLKTVKPEQLAPTANANMTITTIAASLSFIVSGEFVKWNQWGLIRWDIACGVFISAAFFGHFFRPHQNKLPFGIKSLLLSVLLIVLIAKIISQLNA